MSHAHMIDQTTCCFVIVHILYAFDCESDMYACFGFVQVPLERCSS